ncbi:hypothetical protein [Marinisporobacter balticus]|uniref:Lipoprotein n=1 Tax=Marinisporobacter balticus TaxID=2018667 RepID=A0A4V2S9J0_9FIRM|nr:hypothetical protein [Marinisporobacter balticus]TCO68070.1 hypothetical protein EV214_1494 [Marinisporobacter balticus]
MLKLRTVKKIRILYFICIIMLVAVLISGCIGEPTEKEKEEYRQEMIAYLNEKYDEEFVIVNQDFHSNENGAWGYHCKIYPKDRPEVVFEMNNRMYDGYVSTAWEKEFEKIITPVIKKSFGEDVDFYIDISIPDILYEEKIRGKIPTFEEALKLYHEDFKKDSTSSIMISGVRFKDLSQQNVLEEAKCFLPVIEYIEENFGIKYCLFIDYYDESFEKLSRLYIDRYGVLGFKNAGRIYYPEKHKNYDDGYEKEIKCGFDFVKKYFLQVNDSEDLIRYFVKEVGKPIFKKDEVLPTESSHQ